MGALKGPVVILQHGELLGVIDGWVSGLVEEDFVALLPALRRAFSEFDSNERRVIAQKVASTQSAAGVKAQVSPEGDTEEQVRQAHLMPRASNWFCQLFWS